MEHGLKDIAFYVQKHITLHSCHNFPAGLWQAARYTRILKWVYYGNISLGQHWLMTGCCLLTPSHYLNQCWLTSGEVHWHLSQGNLQENYQSKIPFKSPRGQWVNIFWPDAVSLVPPWGYKRNGEICCFSWRIYVTTSQDDSICNIQICDVKRHLLADNLHSAIRDGGVTRWAFSKHPRWWYLYLAHSHKTEWNTNRLMSQHTWYSLIILVK